jgi:hypothetical protein
MASPAVLPKLKKLLKDNKIGFSTFVDDVGKEIRREDEYREKHRMQQCKGMPVEAYPNGADDFFADYHNLDDIIAFNEALAAKYPQLVTSSIIGYSYGNLPIVRNDKTNK